jgi:hypothetical protein
VLCTCGGILQGKETLTHATTWMTLADMILQTRNQTVTKDKYCVIQLRESGVVTILEEWCLTGAGAGVNGRLV